MDHLLSDRIQSLPKPATIAMAQHANLLKSQGIAIINLSMGEPSFKTPQYIQQGAKEAIDTGNYFSYPPVAGYADLQAAIAKKLQRDNHIFCDPSQIVVSNGAKHALANLFLCLLNPGDEVIVYTPYWVGYTGIIQLAGGHPIFLKGEQTDHFKPSAAQLARAITPKTKAIVYSSPCNPTGVVFSKAMLQEMTAVLADYPNILVVADEIYEYINYTEEHTSMASLPTMQDRTITINGFSKGFAMTGWRIGYLAGPLWIAKACEKMQSQITAATCGIAQRAALAALQGPLDPIQAMKAMYLQRRDLMMALLAEVPGLRLTKPEGAFYLFPDISYYFGKTDGQVTLHNADDFCEYILKEAHVALVTGTAFGVPTCVRLSYAAEEVDLRAAVRNIKTALSKLRDL